MNTTTSKCLLFIAVILLTASCKQKTEAPSPTLIKSLSLKRGSLISCGPEDAKLGTVKFPISAEGKAAEDFNLGLKLLHSFEYEDAEKVFAGIIDENPDCAMAYWGVAMSNFHPLWTPPTADELKKGAQAIEIAASITDKTKREAAYIKALSAFYKDSDKLDHRTRAVNFENAMENLNKEYPDDIETSIFYALALTAAADPSDKTFTKQKKAGAILNELYPKHPDHPGLVHYIIHTYDSPELATKGLDAARKYAAIAPSSAHALHMPSHIFTRLGLWDDCISSNLASVASAKCYADSAGIEGHWDEELHGLDYLVYAYLQKGENYYAKTQWDYLKTIQNVQPFNFKVVYAFTAIPSRYVLENKLWIEAATLKVHKTDFSWDTYQWQKAIVHFARALGAVHIENINAAKEELNELNKIHENLVKAKDAYKATQVKIQATAADAWIKLREGKKDEAVQLMQSAVDMEGKTEKHPVTPGEVLPARELLADMYMELKEYAKAMETYEADLKKHPNRFNGLYGAGLAAEKSGDKVKAKFYYEKLLSITDPKRADRQELKMIQQYLKQV
ncbi:MAG: tetratricopeptide repeat protein [Flavisolibacter sp.]